MDDVAVVGVDLAKSVFQIHAIDAQVSSHGLSDDFSDPVNWVHAFVQN